MYCGLNDYLLHLTYYTLCLHLRCFYQFWASAVCMADAYISTYSHTSNVSRQLQPLLSWHNFAPGQKAPTQHQINSSTCQFPPANHRSTTATKHNSRQRDERNQARACVRHSVCLSADVYMCIHTYKHILLGYTNRTEPKEEGGGLTYSPTVLI